MLSMVGKSKFEKLLRELYFWVNFSIWNWKIAIGSILQTIFQSQLNREKTFTLTTYILDAIEDHLSEIRGLSTVDYTILSIFH